MSTFGSWTDLLRSRADAVPNRTAFTFLGDGETATDTLTYAALDRQAKAIGHGLRERGLAGERVLLLYPPGLEFNTAFFGCLYAGAVAVPAFPPRQTQHLARLRAIVADACPAAALTTSAILPRLREAAAAIPEMSGVVCLAAAEVEANPAAWRDPGAGPSTLAFLQYTSGSTATPKGVMVGHGNLMHNCRALAERWGHGADSVLVSWLPSFHDLGLIYGILVPVWGGFHAVLMPPVSFLQRPRRWLQAVSRWRATHSGGPNFAYELCLRRIPVEQRAELDLASWEVAFNGAEPVRPSTLTAFHAAFREQGLRRSTLQPGYGLAEATLGVAAGAAGCEPAVLAVDEASLQRDRIVPAAGGRPMVSCGAPVADTQVTIVQPETRAPCAPGEVGEIWVAGPAVTQGYWRRPQETREVFGARLATGEGPFLRTGDLGFVHDGELYVTGRIKDLVIIRGRNHYPQDLEATAERAHAGLHPGSTAGFAVEVDGEERLIVVAELDRRSHDDPRAVMQAVRQRIAEEHELAVHGIVLARQGSVPRTSSGKIRRRACRSALHDGTLEEVARSFEETAEAADLAVPSGPSPAALAAAGGPRAAEIHAWLSTRLSAALRVAPADLDPGEPLARYGLDSALAVSLAGEIEEWVGRPQPPTLLYDHPTVEALARHLAGAADPRRSLPQPLAHPRREPVAIVGIGCRFPGAAGPQAFWRLLSAGVDAVADHAPRQRSSAGGAGGFLAGVDLFDAAFFGISPREASHMDPQQRLLLEVAWEALEDAGLDPRSLAGARAGVFIGISSADYGYAQFADSRRAAAHAGPGGALSVAANRLSYVLDLHGPSLAVDTACSSSLVALDLACRALADGECALALAGGVNVALMEGTTRSFARAGLIAASGRCRAFDQMADGYVRGEGVGVVVLKPLSRAQADGDPVYAVIRATAVNQDGRTNGLVAPSRQAQEELLREAWRRAGVAPSLAHYVEAHGSGTALGDAIEAAALGAVLAEGRTREAPCLIGSVKTNLGHLESAAGIAGLIKVALSLHHRQVPPSLHFRQPSARIPFAALPLRVATELGPWPEEGPGLAGVSSFGMGGTNAHAVLEEASAVAAPARAAARGWQVLVWSARTESALEELTTRLAGHLADHPGEELADLAFTLQAGRAVLPWRRALVCRDRQDAAAALAARDPRRLLTVERRGAGRPVAFLFPGLADHYPNMGRELYRTEPVFRAELDRCCDVLRPLLGLDPLPVLFPEAAEARPSAGGTLRAWLRPGGAALQGPMRRTAVAQPLLFAVEYALARLLQSWGLAPAALLGFSLGEYVAACLGGTFSLADALEVVARRAALIAQLPEGAMLAVALPAAQIQAWLGEDLSLAVEAGPRNCVVAGPAAAVADLEARLAAAELACRRLPNTHAFHSSSMRAVAPAFAALLQEVRLAPPRLPWISNRSGTRITVEQATDPGYWVAHMCEPVRFADGVRELWREPDMVLLEVGPGQGLTTLALQLAAEPVGRLALPAMRHAHADGSDQEHLLGTMARLWLAGVEVDWRAFHGGPRRRLRLPTYPFERQSFWLPGLVEAEVPAGGGPATPSAPPEPPEPPEPAPPERRFRRPDLATPYVAPADEIERRVAGVLGELLGIADVGVHDNFFEIGGDSLLALQLAARLGAAFDVELPSVVVMGSPTAQGLARLVAAPDAFGLAGGARRSAGLDAPPLLALPREGLPPLTLAQQRTWFLEQLRPGRLMSTAGALRIQGPLDAGALIRAFDAMVSRHESLRTNFAAVDGQPVQVLHPRPTTGLSQVDLAALPPSAQEPEALRIAAADARRPFDLEREPLLRARLFRRGAGEWLVSLALHHIVSDLWSMAFVFFPELAALYQGFAARGTPRLPPLPVQCADVAVWERSWLRGEVLAAHVRYWRGRLAGMPPLLARLADGQAAAGEAPGRIEFPLPGDLVDRLAACAAAEGASRFMVFLAAFDSVLAYAAGAERVAVATNIAGRDRPEVQRLIGGFSRQVALATDLGGDPTFREVLRRVRDTVIEAHAYQALSLNELEERLAGEIDCQHLGDVELTIDPPGPPSLGMGDLRIQLLPRLVDQAESGLALQITQTPGGLRGVLGYGPSLFRAATISRLARLYQAALREIAASPDRTLGQLHGHLADEDARLWSSREEDLARTSLGRLRQRQRHASA